MRKIVLSIFAVLAVSFAAVAQNQRVSGTVTDATGAPIVGANVIVVGTQTGASTGADGSYSIQVPANGSLQFSYVGKVPQTVAVNRRTVINITLVDDAQAIEAVTIEAGYGGFRAGSNVGAIASVSGDLLKATPAANATDALQGQVAGLQVFTSSGDPTAGTTMRVRGINSINASTEPLYLIDGVPASQWNFNMLNANDIESISVLKDASSTAIYGARAANGVIFVTTKKGSRNMDAKVQLSAQSGVSMRAVGHYDLMNAAQLFTFEEANDSKLATNVKYQSNKKIVLDNNLSFNWMDYIFSDSAPINDLNLSIVGGTEKSRYSIGAGYHMEMGTANLDSEMSRYTFRVNYDTELKKWLRIGTNVSISQMRAFEAAEGWYLDNPSLYVINMPSYRAPYVMVQTDPADPSKWAFDKKQEPLTVPNAGTENMVVLYRDYFDNPLTYFNVDGNITEVITPIKNLNFKFTQGLNMLYYTTEATLLPSYYIAQGKEPDGWTSRSAQRLYTAITTNTVDYTFNIGDNHHLTALLGQEAIVNSSTFFGVRIRGLIDDRLVQLAAGNLNRVTLTGGSWSEYVFNSYFGRINYDYQGKYFADVTFRRDGSSRFKDMRYGNFFSVGAMWDIKAENFLIDVDKIDDLTLRVSYGQTGNAGVSNYAWFAGMGSGAQYNGQLGWALLGAGNSQLTWETVGQFSASVEGRAFNFVDFELAFYNKVTSNLLQYIPYSATTGYDGNYGNVGSMRNRGFEFTTGIDVIRNKDMRLRFDFNIAYNKNTILELYNGLTEIVEGGSGLVLKVGSSLGQFKEVRRLGVDPADGRPIWLDKNDAPTKVYSEDDAVLMDMNMYPDWTGGFGAMFSWKGFQINAAFSFVGDKYNWLNEYFYLRNSNRGAGSGNYSTDMLKIWRKEGDITDVPKYGTPFYFDTSTYENASFLRLKQLVVSYNFPKSWLKATRFLDGVRIFFTGRNLLTFTNYPGVDPELDSNGSVGAYPNSRQLLGGIELTF